MSIDDSHGNRRSDYKSKSPERFPCVVRKIPAESVPYGTSMSHNGTYVMGAFDPDTHQMVCYAATAPEARKKYRAIKYRELAPTKPTESTG